MKYIDDVFYKLETKRQDSNLYFEYIYIFFGNKKHISQTANLCSYNIRQHYFWKTSSYQYFIMETFYSCNNKISELVYQIEWISNFSTNFF